MNEFENRQAEKLRAAVNRFDLTGNYLYLKEIQKILDSLKFYSNINSLTKTIKPSITRK